MDVPGRNFVVKSLQNQKIDKVTKMIAIPLFVLIFVLMPFFDRPQNRNRIRQRGNHNDEDDSNEVCFICTPIQFDMDDCVR